MRLRPAPQPENPITIDPRPPDVPTWQVLVIASAPDGDRGPVARTDFKSDEGRQTSLVGSTPTLFRHLI